HDETDVVGPAAPAGAVRERDELIAEVDERHAPAASAEVYVVEDAFEEAKLLVDVLHLDGDVVDPDEARHERSVAAGISYAGAARTRARWARAAARAAMPGSLAHSRPGWSSPPPVKRFGGGRPREEGTAPSVPPRVIASFGSAPLRRIASSAASTTRGFCSM